MAEFLNKCPVCSSKIGRVLERFEDREVYYFISQCSNVSCYSNFINPVLSEEESAKLYNSVFVDYNLPAKSELENKIREHDFISELVSSYLKRNSVVLDFGCGLGYGLANLNRKGFKAIGIDSSAERIKIAHRISKSKVYISLESIDLKPNINGVILWHVLEHIPFPKNFLDDLTKYLAKDAYLFIQVPSYEFAEQYKSSFRTNELYTDVHVNYFTRYNLTTLLRMVNYCVIDTIIDEEMLFITVIAKRM